MVPHALSQLIADLTHVGVDVVTDFLGSLAGEDAEVAAANTHVRTDATDRNADEHTPCGLRLTLKNITQLMLKCYIDI